ncbi:MAG TPA: hypothetical protein VH985_00955 [Candidatus Binatia bacterium]|jgi:hypothetical protein
MVATGAPREYLSAAQPLIELIDELTKREDRNQVFIQKRELTLRLEKKQPPV